MSEHDIRREEILGGLRSGSAKARQDALTIARDHVLEVGGLEAEILEATMVLFHEGLDDLYEKAALSWLWNAQASFGSDAKDKVLRALFTVVEKVAPTEVSWHREAFDQIKESFNKPWPVAVPETPCLADYLEIPKQLLGRVAAMPGDDDLEERGWLILHLVDFALEVTPRDDHQARDWAKLALELMGRFPWKFGLPSKAKNLRETWVDLLPDYARTLGEGLSFTSPAEADGLDGASLVDLPGIQLAEDAFTALADLEGHDDAVIEATAGVEWSDDQRWLFVSVMERDLDWDQGKIWRLKGDDLARRIFDTILGDASEGAGHDKLVTFIDRVATAEAPEEDDMEFFL